MQWTKKICKFCGEPIISYTSGGFGEMEDYHLSCWDKLCTHKTVERMLGDMEDSDLWPKEDCPVCGSLMENKLIGRPSKTTGVLNWCRPCKVIMQKDYVVSVDGG